MAKKKTETSKYKCGQCALAQWLADNRTLNGDLFLLKCPHFKNGEVYHFAKDPACEQFKVRSKTSTID